MKALDTNVVVRFLVNDDVKQALSAKRVFLDAENTGQKLFIPLAVIFEIIWVLGSVFKYAARDILKALEALLALDVLEIDKRELIQEMLYLAVEDGTGLADMLIGLTARENGCDTTLTFDKKAARSSLFELLS